MQGGWGGAMGAGAWGGQPAAPADDDSPRAQAPAATFGANYSANPVAAPYASNGASSQRFQDPPASFVAASPTGSNKEAELRKREADLIQREKRVQEAMQELQRSGVTLKKNNWPICFPFWRHAISEDIPERSRRVVREAYLCWYGLIFCLSYQVFCASVMLGYSVDQKVPSWFMSIIYWLMGVPLSIWLWYMRIYNAARDDSAVGYVAFFVFFFCHWAWCVFCAIAPQINAASWSFSGFMAGFSAFDASTFAGAVYMIGGALWGLEALYSMWVLKDAWFFFRGQGGVREVQQKQKQEAALTAFTQAQQGNGHASNRV